MLKRKTGRFSPTDSDISSKVTLSVLRLPALTEAESLSCVFGLLPPQPAVVTGTSISCQSPAPELLPPVPSGHGEEDESPKCRHQVVVNFSLDSVCLSALRSHDPSCGAGVRSRDHHHGQHDLLRLWRRQPTQPELPVRRTVTHTGQ